MEWLYGERENDTDLAFLGCFTFSLIDAAGKAANILDCFAEVGKVAELSFDLVVGKQIDDVTEDEGSLGLQVLLSLFLRWNKVQNRL